MTILRLPPVRDGSGAIVPATVSVRLEGADGQPVIGFGPSDLATEYTALALDAAPLALPLAPQSAIALPGGEPTWYRIDIRTAHRRETYRVQVPDSAAPVGLADLIGADAIDPADIAATLILPATEARDAAQAAAAAAESARADVADSAAAAAAAASLADGARTEAIAAAGTAQTAAGTAQSAAAATVAAADWIGAHLPDLPVIFLLDQDAESATFGVANGLLVSTGSTPYPHVELEIV